MSTIGVLGGQWRATVSATGGIAPWDGSAALDWFIAADDRWHIPADEPTARQRRIDGAPVLETRIKVPSGDAIHRVWCVADGGGYTVIEIENDSTLPFAVAFNRSDILANRTPTAVPIQGIDLPPDSVVLPVGHRSTVRVAIAHDATTGPGRLPDRLSSPMQVARGWTAVIDAAGRMVLPDDAVLERVAMLRGELALNGPVEPDDDVLGFLIDVGQLVRLGERADPWVPDVAAAVATAARRDHTWESAAALDAAGVVLAKAGEARGLRDLARMRSEAPTSLPQSAPAGRELLWLEQRLARATGSAAADLLGAGIPATWLGANFEVYGLPIGPSTNVSYAVRWHGERPAVLWEMDGPVVPLTASMVAPEWSTAEAKGEALWPAPVMTAPATGRESALPDGDISFN